MTSLEEIKRMLADASPGPWHEDDRGDDIEIVGKGNNCERFNVPDEWTVANVTVDIFDEETVPSRANAKLIAKAPTLIAEIIEQVEQLQKVAGAAEVVCGDAVADSVDPDVFCAVGTPELKALRQALEEIK